MEARELSFEDLHVGDTASFSHEISEEDVEKFAQLSGDYNPLHMDDMYAAHTPFKKRVVHGMYLGGLCSQLVGMHLPGKRCLYLKQDLSFRNPVFIQDPVEVKGTIISISESTRIISLKMEVSVAGTVCAEGEAVVKII